jgi:hypothetical protein
VPKAGVRRENNDTPLRFYNSERRHQGLDRRTPDSVYDVDLLLPEAA